MKKTILFVALLCGMLSLSAQTTVDTTEQAVIQYCSDEVVTGVGNAHSQELSEQSAAAMFTANQLKLYAGNYAVKMSVGLAKDKDWTPEKVESFKFWIRKSLTGANLWEQDYDIAEIEFGAWNELVFDEFYAIDGTSDLYFGYTIVCGGLPIGADLSAYPNDNGVYIYDVDAKRWITYDASGNWNIKVTIAGEKMPSHNLALNGLRTVEFARTDSKFNAVANVSNTLDKEVSSFDFVVYNGEAELYRKTVELDKVMSGGDKPKPIVALKKGESANVFFEGIQLGEEGSYDLTYTLENINGDNDDDNVADSEIVKKINVSNEFDDKVVMLEMFTGATCSNCPAGHNYIHHAIDSLGAEKFVWAAHHVGFAADQFTIDGSVEAVQFFGFEDPNAQSYAPAVMLDRVNLLSVGVTSNPKLNGPAFSANEAGNRDVLVDYMNIIQKNMSPVALDVNFTLDETTRELKVEVEGELLGDFEAKNLRLGVITIEDNIKGSQSGAVGKYNHTYVIRSFMTSAFGDRVTLTDGVFYKDFAQTINAKHSLDNMRLAVWVGKNGNTSNVNGFEVYQAYEVKLNGNPYTAVEFVSDDTKLVVYQEGDKLCVTGIEEGDVLSVYSMEGRLMMQETATSGKVQLDLNGLTKGAYLLQTNGSYVKFVK